jgi:hypothetical protein
MDTMIEHLKELSKVIPLETAYDWEMPSNIPIDIPRDVIGAFSRNIYLKENLASLLESDDELKIHYWIIRDWGGIRTFQVGTAMMNVLEHSKMKYVGGNLHEPHLHRFLPCPNWVHFGSQHDMLYMIHGQYFRWIGSYFATARKNIFFHNPLAVAPLFLIMTLRLYLDFQELTTGIVRTKLHIMTIVLFFRIFRRRFTITEGHIL